MSASAASTVANMTRELPPRTVEELLDREEARALHAIAEALQRAGEELVESADLGPRTVAIRSWPPASPPARAS